MATYETLDVIATRLRTTASAVFIAINAEVELDEVTNWLDPLITRMARTVNERHVDSPNEWELVVKTAEVRFSMFLLLAVEEEHEKPLSVLVRPESVPFTGSDIERTLAGLCPGFWPIC